MYIHHTLNWHRQSARVHRHCIHVVTIGWSCGHLQMLNRTWDRARAWKRKQQRATSYLPIQGDSIVDTVKAKCWASFAIAYHELIALAAQCAPQVQRQSLHSGRNAPPCWCSLCTLQVNALSSSHSFIPLPLHMIPCLLTCARQMFNACVFLVMWWWLRGASKCNCSMLKVHI